MALAEGKIGILAVLSSVFALPFQIDFCNATNCLLPAAMNNYFMSRSRTYYGSMIRSERYGRIGISYFTSFPWTS